MDDTHLPRNIRRRAIKTKQPTLIDRPATWIRYRKAHCKGCWAGCCTLPVEVSPFDLIRLGLTTEDEAAVSLRKLARRLRSEGYIRDFHAKTQLFILEQRNARDCIFLDRHRQCTVYDKRPEVCRRFPSIGPRPGYCPANSSFSL